jgi:hypothetical protein
MNMALVAFIGLGLGLGFGLGVPPQFRWLLLKKASFLQSSNYALPKANLRQHVWPFPRRLQTPL